MPLLSLSRPEAKVWLPLVPRTANDVSMKKLANHICGDCLTSCVSHCPTDILCRKDDAFETERKSETRACQIRAVVSSSNHFLCPGEVLPALSRLESLIVLIIRARRFRAGGRGRAGERDRV